MPRKLLVIIAGESNSAGRALNSDAIAPELAVNPRLKILHNTDLVFQDLNIGTNNIVDHAATDATWRSTRHGWELPLSVAVNSNVFGGGTVHLIKTGQGGSRISEWGAGGAYRTKFEQRVNAARTILGADVTPVIWYTQGINDAIDNNLISLWSSQTKAHFAWMKSFIPGARIMLCELTPPYTAYSDECRRIARSMGGVTLIPTKGAGLDNGDGNHWGYHGVKTIGSRLIKATLAKTTPRRFF